MQQAMTYIIWRLMILQWDNYFLIKIYMGNLSFKTRTQCCIDSSNFNEEEDENILEESSCNTNKEEIIIKKNEVNNDSFRTVIN